MLMGKIENFYKQKKCWKVQEVKSGKDILEGKLMRHG